MYSRGHARTSQREEPSVTVPGQQPHEDQDTAHQPMHFRHNVSKVGCKSTQLENQCDLARHLLHFHVYHSHARIIITTHNLQHRDGENLNQRRSSRYQSCQNGKDIFKQTASHHPFPIRTRTIPTGCTFSAPSPCKFKPSFPNSSIYSSQAVQKICISSRLPHWIYKHTHAQT